MNDLIRRQAAIDALGEEPMVWSGKDEYEQGRNNQWQYDLNAIKAVPAAQPKIGKWLYRIGWIGAEWICSECGERTISAVMGKPRYIYCPICGAKMEG